MEIVGMLSEMAADYAKLYIKRPAGVPRVGGVFHVEASDFNLRFRIDTEYSRDKEGAKLFVIEMAELSPEEFKASSARNERKRNSSKGKA
jgi:hypothetical protein